MLIEDPITLRLPPKIYARLIGRRNMATGMSCVRQKFYTSGTITYSSALPGRKAAARKMNANSRN